MKILITGAYGQLGNEISRIVESGSCPLGEINSLFKEACLIRTGSSDLNIGDLTNVLEYVKSVKPDLIINAAAYTDVDGCEKNTERALKVNSIGSRNIAIAASIVNAKLVCISTDYVFSGDSAVPYKEYDPVLPQNVYGKTKFLGEKYVQQFCMKHFIIRTSWLYGASGRNFVKWVIERAKSGGTLKVVCDQRGNPTNAGDLVYHIFKIVQSEEYGIYHCSGNGECSRYELAQKIIEILKLPCTLSGINSSELNQTAKRPAYSSLDNLMLRCTLGDGMRHWEDALEGFLSTL